MSYIRNVRRREVYNENVSVGVEIKAAKKNVNPGDQELAGMFKPRPSIKVTPCLAAFIEE